MREWIIAALTPWLWIDAHPWHVAAAGVVAVLAGAGYYVAAGRWAR